MKKILITLFICSFAMISCHDDLNQLPNSTISTSSFFKSSSESETAVNGVYNGLYGQNGPFGQYFMQMSMHGSHAITNLSQITKVTPQNKFAQFLFDSSERPFSAVWEGMYKIIFRANQAISKIEASGADDPYSTRIIGEAKFLRALSYFYLVRFYGDVPLFDAELVDFSDVERPRTDSNIIYDFIIADLKYAEEHLFAPHWIEDENVLSYTAADLGRATNTAAKGMLAKVYLSRASYPLKQDAYYELAFDKAKEVMELGYHDLDADYASLFTVAGEQSHEWMFQIQFDSAYDFGNVWGGVNNPGGHKNAIDLGFGRYQPTLNLIAAYDETDPRYIHNIAKGRLSATNTIQPKANQSNWYDRKYRFASQAIGRFHTDMNAPILRYADVILIYAEAAANSGNEPEAINALNLIRTRAQAGGSSPALFDNSLTGDDLTYQIMWERARELCFEGHARFDITRMGEAIFNSEVKEMQYQKNATKVEDVPWKNNIVFSTHKLFPIPEAERRGNSLMGQNDGY